MVGFIEQMEILSSQKIHCHVWPFRYKNKQVEYPCKFGGFYFIGLEIAPTPAPTTTSSSSSTSTSSSSSSGGSAEKINYDVYVSESINKFIVDSFSWSGKKDTMTLDIKRVKR